MDHDSKEAAAVNRELKAAMAQTRKSVDGLPSGLYLRTLDCTFDVSRAYDEAEGIKKLRIWIAERDKDLWATLQA